MKNFIVGLAVVGLWFGSYSSRAQEWLDLYNQGVDDYQNYDLVSAKSNCEKALNIFTSEVDGNHKNTAAILRQLTLICYESNDLDQGLVYAKREQDVLKSIGEADKLVFGTALYNEGLILSAYGKWQQAVNVLSKALSLHEVYLEENDPAIADVQGVLAGAYFYTGASEKAKVNFEKSLSVLDQQESASPEYFNITYTYAEFLIENNRSEEAVQALLLLTEFYDESSYDETYGSLVLKIGTTYESLGDYVKAKENYRLSIQVFGTIGAETDPDNQIALSSLSYVLIQEGSLDEATKIMSDLVATRAGRKDETYFTAVANLGNIYFTNSSFAEAADKYQEVLGYYETVNSPRNEAYFMAAVGMALVNLDWGNNNEAVTIIDAALNDAENLEEWKVQLLKSKAQALTASGKYQASQELLEEALVLIHSDTEKRAEIKLSLATLYTVTHDLEKAEVYFTEVKLIYESKQQNAKLHYSSYLGSYANYLQVKGHYLQAENALEKSIESKREILGESNANYLSSYENLGLLYLTQGKYLAAQEIFEGALETKKSMSDLSKASLAYTRSNLGMVNKYQGEYTRSEDNFKVALEIYREEYGDDHVHYANVANELGLLYMKMGNLKAAEPLFLTAKKTYKIVYSNKHVEYASALENLAALYNMQGDLEKSKVALEEVLVIDKEVLGTHHPLYSKTLHNLASTFEEMGEYEQASRLYEEAIRIYQELFGTEHPSYANTLYNIAVLEQEIGNYEGAKVHYQQVIEIRRNILNEYHPDLAYSVFGLASVKQKLSDWEGAKEDYDFVIDSYLHSIHTYFPSLSEEEKSALYAKIKPVFEAYQDFAIEYVTDERGDVEAQKSTLRQVYNLQLSTKALLLNATSKVKNRIMTSGDAELISKYEKWILLKENLVKALSMSKEELRINEIDIQGIQAESNQAEKELSRMSQSFAGEYENTEITWKAIRDFLAPDEAAVEILRIKKNTKNDSVYYAVLVIRGNQAAAPELVIVSDGENLDTKMFKQYKNMIVFKIENPRSFSQYWSTIDEKLDGMKKVFLSSDGVYNKININTLYDPDKKEYVFDKYTIYLLSNTKELVEGSVESEDMVNTNATIFGFPDYEMGESSTVITAASTERGFEKGIAELPGTLEEINNISTTLDKYGWTYEEFERAEANETNIKKVNSPTLLHVATHGFFMPTINIPESENAGLQSREAEFNPLFRSGLLFAGAAKTFRHEKFEGEDDGILTAYEAMNLNLDETELVVMSACETGLGEVKNGEGVYGLQRAFIVAGADNLIMSLWKVNDETTQKLMSTFYSNWIGGQPKQAAFHDAIKTLKSEYKEPYYWGAFVMLGN